MDNKYANIINMPHHISPTRARMSLSRRAAQFAPFAALTGYDAELAEAARLTAPPVELTENEEQRLNDVYRYLQDHISRQPRVTVTYFQPDSRKAGGAYITLTAPVKKVDAYTQSITLATGEIIPMSRIVSITANM